ncbi:type II toxin-antitoxin system HicB family antitoxin [Bifidobacterium avesanii]|uniref:Toxin-antitoxin system HicB family antitoxin n=1 Tax=Bifidobacterium avesanii TaxID=1798157 RepID=A0A7K3THY0_9BIFI|nr:type II toxin-antitoxin system HicB family antitoxin [Bifidobacterium avesanii]KAB8291508.1 antitoxin HicB [Bifidobacterium avesanii]NEG77863.1 toxin-antitoxin system HicB family antitoxin [Bifidobacterium avesanii]
MADGKQSAEERPVADRYIYRIHWLDKEGGFVCTVAELPDLRFVSESSAEALLGLRVAVDARLKELRENGEEIPVPFEDRHYSGHFLVRIPPEMHRRLAIEAAEQKVSINRLIQSRLG